MTFLAPTAIDVILRERQVARVYGNGSTSAATDPADLSFLTP